jgi:hypothetical protein
MGILYGDAHRGDDRSVASSGNRRREIFSWIALDKLTAQSRIRKSWELEAKESQLVVAGLPRILGNLSIPSCI